jgi:hypothetical protein
MNIGTNIENTDEIGTDFSSMKDLVLSTMSAMSIFFRNRHNKSKTDPVISIFKNRNMDTMDNRDRRVIFLEEIHDVCTLQIKDKNKDRTSKNKDRFKNKKSQKKKSYLSIFGLSFTRSIE